MLFAISKISDSYLILDDLPKTSKSTSLLIRIVNIIDNSVHAGITVTNSMVKEWILDFNSELDVPKRSLAKATLSSTSSATGKSVRKVFVCNDYNNGQCNYKEKCRYKHVCKKHYNKFGTQEAHPESECSLE